MKTTAIIFIISILLLLQQSCRTNFSPLEADNPLNKLSNTQIVFVSTWESWYHWLYIMNINGDNLVQLTDENSNPSYPRFTPDGKNIIFSGCLNNSQCGIFMASINNREQVHLICNKGGHSLKISPDGNHVVMHSQGSSGYDIFLIDITTGIPINLTHTDSSDTSPSFSPDGNEIVFQSERDGNSEIYLVDLDGNNLRNLSNNPADDGSPIFTPNGSRILFWSKRDGNAEVYIMNRDGSNQINLTHHPYDDYPKDISPDGSKVLFISLQNNNYEIFSMDITGNRMVNLTKSPAMDIEPRYSSNGETIFFMSALKGLYDIFVMNSDGSHPMNLTKTRDRDEFHFDIYPK